MLRFLSSPDPLVARRNHGQLASRIGSGIWSIQRAQQQTEATWLEDYLSEVTTFPMGKYDDQVDSTSQALDWIKQRPRRGFIVRPLQY